MGKVQFDEEILTLYTTEGVVGNHPQTVIYLLVADTPYNNVRTLYKKA